MVRFWRWIFVTSLLATCTLVWAVASTTTAIPNEIQEQEILPAFPGAKGFGTTTPGGRGGAVVHVTTREDEGPGSLRAALEDRTDRRIVVFAVGGAIALSREIAVGPNVTVLGQTAPTPGVTLTGARLKIVGSDVIIRGLRVRPGLEDGQSFEGRDGISVGTKELTVARVVIAQNSVSWATDENLATWYDVEDVTFQRNLVAEALNNAGHPEGAHSMGMLIGRTAERVSIIENILVSNRWRNPQVSTLIDGEIINNVFHNYGPGGLSVSKGPSQVDIIGNLFTAGPNTVEPQSRAPILLKAEDPNSHFFVVDNLMPLLSDSVRGPGRTRLSRVAVVDHVASQARSAYDLPEILLEQVGARQPALDMIDKRLLSEIQTGQGAVVDVPPRIQPERKDTMSKDNPDRDGDLIPDIWEERLGSDPDQPDAATIASSGYAFIEEYVNEIDP